MGKNGTPYSLEYIDRLDTLRHHVSNLQPIEGTEDLQLLDRVGGKYFNRVRHDLKNILSKEPLETVDIALEDYLKQLWPVICGSVVSYTIPLAELIAVLFEATLFVCFSKNYYLSEDEAPITPFEVMMPGMILTSQNLTYPNLQSTAITWSEEKEDQLNELSIQKTELEADCPTEEETEEYTFLKNEIKGIEYDLKHVDDIDTAGTNECYADAVAEKEALVKKLENYKPRIQVLEKKMQQQALYRALLSLEAAKEDFIQSKKGCIEVGKWLVPTYETLRNALHQSILSQHEGTFSLIPVALLLSADEKLVNPYNVSAGFITPEEMQRLTDHSGETFALVEARKAKHRYYHDPNHLLGQLSLLCTALKQNDAHEGFGQQTHAGFGAYPAIIAFASYYETLDEETKAKIPEPVKAEIDLLLSLSSDPEKNKDATGNMLTCIGTRREQLDRLIALHKTELSDISCDETQHAILVQNAEERLKQTIDNLSASLEKGTYRGSDKLGLTQKLLEFLNIQLTFESAQEVEALMSLSAQEMREVIADDASIDMIVSHFNNIEELVMFIHNHPSRQLDAFFSVVGSVLVPQLTYRMEDVTAILTSLTQEKFKVVFKVLEKEVKFSWEPGAILQVFCDDLERTNLVLDLVGEDNVLKTIKERDRHHITPLHRAAEKNAAVFFRLFDLYPTRVAQMAAIRMKDDAGNSVLRYAASNTEVFIHLMTHYFGEDAPILFALRERNQVQDTIFFHAVSNPDVMQWLALRLGAVNFTMLADLKNSEEATALHAAVPNLRSMRIILANYPNDLARFAAINERTQAQETVLHFAATYHPGVLDFLLALYATHRDRWDALCQKDALGKTVFHVAIDYEAMITVVFDHLPRKERATALQQKDKSGLTVLDRILDRAPLLSLVLSSISQEECCRLMQLTNYRGQTYLHRVAADPDSVDAILRLLPIPFVTNLIRKKTTQGDTVLHEASNLSSFLMLWSILSPEDKLSALQEKNQFGDTVLHEMSRYPEIVTLISRVLSPTDWFKLLKMKNKDQSTFFHLIVHDVETVIACLDPLSGSARLKILNLKNREGDTVLHHVKGGLALERLLEQLPIEERLSAINAKNRNGDSLLLVWSRVDLVMEYHLLGLLPASDRLKALLEKNFYDKSILIEATYPWHSDKITRLKRILSVLPPKDRIRALKMPYKYYSVWEKITQCPETIALVLEEFDEIDRLILLKETDDGGLRALDRILSNKKILHPVGLLEDVLALIPPKERLSLILKKNTYGYNAFQYAENRFMLKALLMSLPIHKRLEAIKAEDGDNQGILYKVKRKADMLQVVLESLTRAERLEVLCEIDPMSPSYKPHSLLETLAADTNVLTKVLALIAHRESLNVSVLRTVEKYLYGQRHHVFVKDFYTNCIASFKEEVPPAEHPLIPGRFFLHTTPSQVKNTAIQRVLSALREGGYAILNEQHLMAIQQTPMLQKTIASYEQVSGLCVLTRRDARWAAMA
ncbi:MAG: hypothetical protein H2069_05050 [Legionella sp.]|nr:hypothetical protein [Legionella sp.]